MNEKYDPSIELAKYTKAVADLSIRYGVTLAASMGRDGFDLMQRRDRLQGNLIKIKEAWCNNWKCMEGASEALLSLKKLIPELESLVEDWNKSGKDRLIT
jgi:hypothetical protein